MTEKSALLFKEDGVESRIVSLSCQDDGSIRLYASDVGPTAERFWGSDEYEFWVTITAESVTDLAFALLKQRFSGRSGAVDELREFCEQNGIKHAFDQWT